MASFSRKLKRKQQVKARKVVQKQFKNALKSTMTMEKKCNICSKDFKDVSKEEGLGWMVRYNGIAAELQCPVCFSAQSDESEDISGQL